jgi:hypothetical protein
LRIPVYKDSKAIQVPEQSMIKEAITKKFVFRKEFANKLLQTDDLLEEELLRQLRDWKDKRGLQLFP